MRNVITTCLKSAAMAATMISVTAGAQTPKQIMNDSSICSNGQGERQLQNCKATLMQVDQYFARNAPTAHQKIYLYQSQASSWAGLMNYYNQQGRTDLVCRAVESAKTVDEKQAQNYSQFANNPNFSDVLSKFAKSRKATADLVEYCRGRYGALQPLTLGEL